MLSRIRNKDDEAAPEDEARSGGPKGRDRDEAAPTMIVPRGTDISVDAHGQLSIRAPGNLVLQNSGSYGTLESVNGSIRIEKNVNVEAVSVRCAQHCYVQGHLTAWTVEARTLQIEDSGQAHVILQETESLEVGREGRLVGNFASEKELFLLFSRFADQLRSLPLFDRPRGASEGEGGSPGELSRRLVSAGAGATSDPAEPPPSSTPPSEARTGSSFSPDLDDDDTGVEAAPAAGGAAGRAAQSASAGKNPGPAGKNPGPAGKDPSPAGEGKPAREGDLPEPLLFALVLLERELDRGSYGPTSTRAMTELVKLLRERDLAALQQIYRTLFARVVEPREDTRRARELVEEWRGAMSDKRPDEATGA